MKLSAALDALDQAAAEHIKHLFDILRLGVAQGGAEETKALERFEAGLANTVRARDKARALVSQCKGLET